MTDSPCASLARDDVAFLLDGGALFDAAPTLAYTGSHVRFDQKIRSLVAGTEADDLLLLVDPVRAVLLRVKPLMLFCAPLEPEGETESSSASLVETRL